MVIILPDTTKTWEKLCEMAILIQIGDVTSFLFKSSDDISTQSTVQVSRKNQKMNFLSPKMNYLTSTCTMNSNIRALKNMLRL